MALPVIATLLVAFALALASPSPAQQENVLNVGKYTQLGSYDPHAGALDTLWWTGNNFRPGVRVLPGVNPKTLKDHGQGDQAPGWLRGPTAGTGPYGLEKLEPNIIHVGKKNAHYWRGWPANKFTTINLRHIYEPET